MNTPHSTTEGHAHIARAITRATIDDGGYARLRLWRHVKACAEHPAFLFIDTHDLTYLEGKQWERCGHKLYLTYTTDQDDFGYPKTYWVRLEA